MIFLSQPSSSHDCRHSLHLTIPGKTGMLALTLIAFRFGTSGRRRDGINAEIGTSFAPKKASPIGEPGALTLPLRGQEAEIAGAGSNLQSDLRKDTVQVARPPAEHSTAISPTELSRMSHPSVYLESCLAVVLSRPPAHSGTRCVATRLSRHEDQYDTRLSNLPGLIFTHRTGHCQMLSTWRYACRSCLSGRNPDG
jgi:hypothetical protein